MKVLSVVSSYWPAFKFGGPIYSVHYLNRALAEMGVEVDVYSTNTGLENLYTSNETRELDGVNVTYFEYSKYFEFLGNSGWNFSPSLYSALSNNVAAYDIVYVVAVWNFPVAAACHLCRKNGVKYVISPRGLLYPQTTGRKSWKKSPYYKLVSERDLRNASAIHYTTMDEAEKCHGALGLENQAFVVPNGIKLSEFSDLPGKDALREKYPYLGNRKILLYLGRLNWKKGLDILIDAFSKLRRIRDDIHLIIAGNDEEGYSDILKKRIIQNGLAYSDLGLRKDNLPGHEAADPESAHITFTGMVSGRDKLELLAGSDVFVLASSSENFGMSVVEAMASGTPAIISDMVGIHREAAESESCIVIKNSPSGLASAVEKVLDDKVLYDKISQNAKRHVENYYDIKKTAEMMKAKFESVISAS